MIATLGSGLKAIDTQGAQFDPGFGSPQRIGELFLTRFLLAFEVASFLLLVAAVGAIVLARRRRGLPGDETEGVGIITMPASVGTQAESVGDSLERSRHRDRLFRGGW